MIRRMIAKNALVFLMVVVFFQSTVQSAENDKFVSLLDKYFALASERDISKIEPLWVRDAAVVLVFPSDKQAAVGWDAVKKSYQARFDSVSEWKLSAKETPHIQSYPGSVITTTPVLIEAKDKAGAPVSYSLLFTQVFVQRGDQWLLVASHGSRIPN